MYKNKRSSYRNGQRSVGSLVEELAKPVFKKHGFAETKLLMAWNEIVGSALAQVTTPEKLQFHGEGRKSGTLYIRVLSGWALEIQHMEPQILDRIATYIGYRAVEKLRITQSATAGRKDAHPIVKAKSLATSADEDASIDQILARMRDLVQ